MASTRAILEVGYGAGEGDKAFAVGAAAAKKARSSIKAPSLSAVLVFASVRHDLEEVLQGIHSVMGDAPVVGVTTAGEILDEPHSQSVVLLALASPYLKVRVGVGEGVSRNWRQAVKQAVSAPEIKPYFSPPPKDIWPELTRQGKSAFAVLFSPGNTRVADSRSFEILEELKGLSQGRLPIIGGAAADDWRLEANYVLWGPRVFPDSLLLAVFETQLRFGIGLAHGFRPTRQRATVTRSHGHEVMELDGQPAAARYSRLHATSRKALEGKHLTLTTTRPVGIPDPYGQYSINVASFFTPAGGIRFSQPVPEGAVLTLMTADQENLIAAGPAALRKALLRGAISDPAVVLVFSCALRTRILKDRTAEEISQIKKVVPGVPVVGFYSFGVQGLADDGVNRHNNEVIAVLALSRELTHGAQVALENERLRQEVEQRTAELITANEGLQQEIADRRVAETALKESEEKYRLLVNQIPAVVFKSYGDWSVDFFDRKIETLTGYRKEDFDSRGVKWCDLIPAADFDYVQKVFIEALKTDKSYVREHRLRKKNGEIIWVQCRGQIFCDAQGKVDYISGVSFDVTRRRQAEEALRENERFLTHIFASIQDGISILDTDFNILRVNQTIERWFSHVLPLVGQKCYEAYYGRRNPCEPCPYRQTMETGNAAYKVSPRMRERGEAVGWLEIFTFPMTDPATGKVRGAIEYVRDITERRRAEEALRQSEERYRNLVENINLGITLIDSDHRIVMTNAAMGRLFNKPAHELVGKECFREFEKRDAVCAHCPGERTMATGLPAEVETAGVLDDGSTFAARLQTFPSYGPDGEITGYIEVVEDITRRQQAEQALRESESFLASIFASIQDGISVLDNEFNIVRVNPTMERIFAQAMPLVGKKCFQAYHGRTEPCKVCPSRQTLETQEAAYEVVPMTGPGGEAVGWLDLYSFPLMDAASGKMKGVIEYVRDITERKQAEDRLCESESRYSTLLENLPQKIFLKDRDSVYISCNENYALDLGISPNQIKGMTDYDFYPKELAEKYRIDDKRVMEEGSPADIEEQYIQDGKEVWVHTVKTPVRDERGNTIGILGIFWDITERKQAEEALRQSEEQLRQAQKMEAVGRLAGGVAHDFNNILTTIIGYSELLLLNLGEVHPLRPDVKDIQQAAERAATLTRQLLAFSRKQIFQPKVLDLNEIVNNLDKMLRRLIGEDVDLVTVLGPHPGIVKADPGQIEQVIMNLVVNSRDAMPQGGKLTIETANVELDAAYARQHLEVQPGPYVMLAVTDTGVGLDAEARTRIFEPFFTTKEKGKGTGLGLSTVYGIVRQSGGHIWVYSEPGRGTTFKIYLPRIEEAAETMASSITAASLPRGSGTVLLVEDEDMVRLVARKILQRNGYTVLEAADGPEAFRVSESHPGPIHLVLTDVVLPGISGREIVTRLQELRPEMRVLYMSGHTENAIVHHGVLEPGIAFIPKPFRHDTLVHKVQELLDLPRQDQKVPRVQAKK